MTALRDSAFLLRTPAIEIFQVGGPLFRVLNGRAMPHNFPAVAGARPTGRVPRRAAAATGRRERQPSVLSAV